MKRGPPRRVEKSGWPVRIVMKSTQRDGVRLRLVRMRRGQVGERDTSTNANRSSRQHYTSLRVSTTTAVGAATATTAANSRNSSSSGVSATHGLTTLARSLDSDTDLLAVAAATTAAGGGVAGGFIDGAGRFDCLRWLRRQRDGLSLPSQSCQFVAQPLLQVVHVVRFGRVIHVHVHVHVYSCVLCLSGSCRRLCLHRRRRSRRRRSRRRLRLRCRHRRGLGWPRSSRLGECDSCSTGP